MIFHLLFLQPERGSLDLLEKVDVVNKGYTLCQDHLEAKVFTNNHCDRLNFNPVPTLFRALEGSSIGDLLLDLTYTPIYNLTSLENETERPIPKINILQDLVISTGKL